MPNVRDHYGQANRNQGVIDHLLIKDPPSPEWVATVAFYKALHLVDAVLAMAKIHPADHASRERHLKSDRRYKHICKHYLLLLNVSVIARYLSDRGGRAYRTFTDYMDLAAVKDQVLSHLLHQVEVSAKKFTAPAPRPGKRPRKKS